MPVLPSGYNADENNGDEVDGAGVNRPVYPELTDFFIGLEPIVLTEDMLAVFATECPDIVFPMQPDTVVIPPDTATVVVRKAG